MTVAPTTVDRNAPDFLLCRLCSDIGSASAGSTSRGRVWRPFCTPVVVNSKGNLSPPQDREHHQCASEIAASRAHRYTRPNKSAATARVTTMT